MESSVLSSEAFILSSSYLTTQLHQVQCTIDSKYVKGGKTRVYTCTCTVHVHSTLAHIGKKER